MNANCYFSFITDFKIKFKKKKNQVMEFPFNCEKSLGCDADGFVILDGRKPIGGASLLQ